MDFYVSADPQHIKKEREKARLLRKTGWWKNQLAKGFCSYCEGQFPPRELTMDHRIPVSRGGQSTKGNVVPCCKVCNTDKKNKTPVELILNDLEFNLDR